MMGLLNHLSWQKLTLATVRRCWERSRWGQGPEWTPLVTLSIFFCLRASHIGLFSVQETCHPPLPFARLQWLAKWMTSSPWLKLSACPISGTFYDSGEMSTPTPGSSLWNSASNKHIKALEHREWHYLTSGEWHSRDSYFHLLRTVFV